MLLGILSDTHDQLKRTQHAVDQLVSEGCEALIHCGDLIGPDIVRACARLPLHFVLGNNDADMVLELNAVAAETGSIFLNWGGIVELGGKRLGVTHGHSKVDLRRVQSHAPDYIFSGHSHVRADRMEGAIRRINPGALHRADEFTVAVLDLETGELRFLKMER